MNVILLSAGIGAGISLVAWIYLVAFRGQFWRTDLILPPPNDTAIVWPVVSVLIPARNEADVLPSTLATLLTQDYPSPYKVFLIDDRSDDETASVAKRIAEDSGADERLTIVTGKPLPAGWTGKVWALEQGVSASESSGSEFLLLTDADISHSPNSLRKLVSKAQSENLDMVSLMARLHVKSAWERLLIPAFVYFFAKLYPFRWSNDARKNTAAAAGGCILVRRDSLEKAGGLKSIASALIDDCSLADRIKNPPEADGPQRGKIWLGLTQEVRSTRPYVGLADVWNMVARTAFAQLNFSLILLMGTVLGMILIYLIPPLATIGGMIAIVIDANASSIWLFGAGLATWALMSASYVSMLRWHDTSLLYAPTLPLAGVLYTMMTVDSARRWRQGKGGAWKGRTYDVGIRD